MIASERAGVRMKFLLCNASSDVEDKSTGKKLIISASQAASSKDISERVFKVVNQLLWKAENSFAHVFIE